MPLPLRRPVPRTIFSDRNPLSDPERAELEADRAKWPERMMAKTTAAQRKRIAQLARRKGDRVNHDEVRRYAAAMLVAHPYDYVSRTARHFKISKTYVKDIKEQKPGK